MPRYTDASKERVRDAIDIVDLVGSKVELRRSGGVAFSGLCPFHEERTPSFSVDAAKKVYHCFGCGRGGDGFTFVRELEGLDFVGALEYLADRYNVELEVADEDPREAEKRQRRERLLELLERAATFYVRTLWESQASEAAAAREYLAGRGFEETVLREFRVGYAPSAWDSLLLGARKQGFGDREIYDAGLSQRNEKSGRTYDRFRRRIMFPLADRRGRVLGFGARAMGEDQQPKYLNTSENELFHKRSQLFAADVARAAAAKAGETIVAEGYMDVVALHQAGLRNAVGIMGTSLTEQQVEGLAGLAPTVLLALDADDAGQEAMLRAAKVAASRKLELRVVPMPKDSDPADIVERDGAEAVTRLMGSSVPLVRFQVERALDTADLSNAEGKDRVLGALRPVFKEIPASVMRQELLALVAARLDLADTVAADLLGQPPQPAAAPPPTASGNGASSAAPRASGSPAERIERTFLALCLALPTHGRELLAEIPPEHFTPERTRRAAEHLRTHLDDPLAGLAEDDAEFLAFVQQLA